MSGRITAYSHQPSHEPHLVGAGNACFHLGRLTADDGTRASRTIAHLTAGQPRQAWGAGTGQRAPVLLRGVGSSELTAAPPPRRRACRARTVARRER